MKLTHPWAITASLTVCASFVLAMNDPTYRPAFVQVAMVAVAAAKEHAVKDADTEEDRCVLPPDGERPVTYGAPMTNVMER